MRKSSNRHRCCSEQVEHRSQSTLASIAVGKGCGAETAGLLMKSGREMGRDWRVARAGGGGRRVLLSVLCALLISLASSEASGGIEGANAFKVERRSLSAQE